MNKRTKPAKPRKYQAGDRVADRPMRSVHGRPLQLLDPARLTHVQFRRFAGCPACSLHLRSVVARHAEISAAGIRELVIFHSADAKLLKFVADFPFDIVGDPQKRLYAEFGIEPSPWALIHPRAWLPMVRGIALDLRDLIRAGKPLMSLRQEHGFLGVPADLLIASDGTVLAAKYGTYNFDQWSVDDLLSVAAQHGPALRKPAQLERLT